MENSNYIQQQQSTNRDPNLTKMDNSTSQANNNETDLAEKKLDQPNIADLLEKISTCMPLLNQAASASSSSAPTSSMTASNSDSAVQDNAVNL